MPPPRLTWWRSGKLLDDTDEEVIFFLQIHPHHFQDDSKSVLSANLIAVNAQTRFVIQSAPIYFGGVRHVCRDVYLPFRSQMTVGGVAGERADNQHDGAGGQPHQGRQQGPHRVQVRGGGQY